MEHTDTEPDVATLLDKNRALIDELKEALADVLDPKVHDDIFLLRYALSYKKRETCENHIRAGLEYRKEHSYLELEKQGKMHPAAENIRQYTCASYHGKKKDGGPVQVIRAGLTNISGLFANCRVEDIIEEMTLSKENAYHMCDTQTRKTGKLVKQIVIFDMANVGWIMPSTELVSSQNKASEIAKHLYPQLLDKVVIINAPWFMSQLWKVAKMVLSESLTGKVAMCSGSIVPDGMSACPYASSHFASLDELPSFVGGSCRKCVPGCVGEVSNDCTTMKAGGVAAEVTEAEREMAERGEEQQEGEQAPAAGGGWLSGWW